MSSVLRAGLIILGSTAIFAQDITKKPTFEVASVRQATPPNDGRPATMHCGGGPGTSNPERLGCTNAALKMLICMAYEVQYYQVTGPGSMDTDGYDIAAKIPAGATQAEYKLMLQNLLAERFKLTLHHDTKDIPTHTLVVAKGGSKLRRSANDAPSVNGAAAAPGLVVSTVGNQVRVTAKKQMLSNLAGFLSTRLGVEGPVTNETGLAGDYDFVLEFTYEAAALTGDNNALSLFTALESQLGLKLETKKRPVDILVIDHAEKKPTEN